MSEMVERVAKALFASEYDIEAYPWEGEASESQNEYRRLARVAIAAMREHDELTAELRAALTRISTAADIAAMVPQLDAATALVFAELSNIAANALAALKD